MKWHKKYYCQQQWLNIAQTCGLSLQGRKDMVSHLGKIIKYKTYTVSICRHQSVTYRYREFVIFLVVTEHVSEQIGTGKSLGKICYREKVSEPVLEKFGTGKKSRNQ